MMISDKKQSAFTLLELIIVVIIIGILTMLALPRLFDVVKCAGKQEVMAVLVKARREMESAILMNSGDISTVTNYMTNPTEDAGYCWFALADTEDDEFYMVGAVKDSNNFCSSIDLAMVKSNGIWFRTNQNGFYKFYGLGKNSDCFTHPDDDPDSRTFW